MKIIFQKGYYIAFISKIILMLLFSSDFQNVLFIPFVSYFLDTFNNPWEYYFKIGSFDLFPYPPIMLYILSFFYSFYKIFHLDSILLQNFFFKLPLILSDLVIAYFLLKLFPKNQKQVLIYYFISPIIIYSAFMHSQLDLIPTALLFATVYYLINGQTLLSSILYGLTIGSKHHTLIALPLLITYILKNYGLKNAIIFIVISFCLFATTILPYIYSEGFYQLIFNNPTQMLIFDSFYQIGQLKLYLPIFVSGILCLRFVLYKKINRDLLYAYLSLLFATFIVLVNPAPGWYIWISPFIAILFIKYNNQLTYTSAIYTVISIVFVLYFIFFFIPEYNDLIFVEKIIDFKIRNSNLHNMAFTALEVLLVGIIYSFYKVGVKSNRVYQRNAATIIGVSGDSAAGKSTLLEDLYDVFGHRLIKIEGDGDHKWERNSPNWDDMTHLNPRANFLHRQSENILSLKSGKSIIRTDYDHDSGRFTEKKVVEAKDFVVISGLHTLYLPKMRKALDLSIYLAPDTVVNTKWKILRDTINRGYKESEVIENIEKRSEDSKKYILPQKDYADIIISYSIDNNISLDDYDESMLELIITFDSSIYIEFLLLNLRDNKIETFHDYSEDLKTQTLHLKKPPNIDFIINSAFKMIKNIEEIAENPVWKNGYRGIVQLILLLHISEKLQDKSYA